MSDDPTTDAEIISAYLDGEATPAEVARVRADPSLRSAAADLEVLRDQLSVDGPPAGLVDDHVGAALAAFDGEHGDDEPAAGAVTDLSTRRRPLLQRLPLGVIAAAVVLLALFGALTQIDTGDDDTASDETAALDAAGDGDDAAEEADGGSEAYSMPDAADDHAGSGAESAPYLQAFTDTDDLARHLSTRLDELETRDQPADEDMSTTGTSTTGSDATQERAVNPCDAVAVAGVDPSTVTLVFPAVVAGMPVTAVVDEPAGDGERRLVVVDDGSCTVIDDRPL